MDGIQQDIDEEVAQLTATGPLDGAPRVEEAEKDSQGDTDDEALTIVDAYDDKDEIGYSDLDN